MRGFGNMAIKTKIIVSFSAISLLMILALYQDSQSSARMVLAVCAVALGPALGFLVASSIRRQIGEITMAAEKVAAGETEVQISAGTTEEIGRLADLLTGMAQSQKTLAQAAAKISQGDFSVSIAMRGDRDILGQAMQQCVSNLRSLDQELSRLTEATRNGRFSERAKADTFRGAYSTLIASINGLLDELIRPVGRAIKVMDRVGKRDLTARLQGEYKGDFARLQESLNLTVSTLDEALASVARSADNVSTAAGQINTGSQRLSHGASAQAGSIQEVSSSLQEVESMARQNTENAVEARNLSKAAESAVEMGVDSMRRLSEAIGRIKISSDSTAKIVKTIDEIAFQTNLLALNAAVEAARAGDAGKGFAVVAEEVRNLAMRSAEAAKNTANLIEESVRNSESGVSLNQEVLRNLSDINSQVKKVGTVMAEIAAASEQQNHGVAQVNSVITQMRQVTQDIAANAEQSAGGAEELSEQSEDLKKMVFAFRLSADRFSAGSLGNKMQAADPELPAPRPKTSDSGMRGRPNARRPHSGAVTAAAIIPFSESEMAGQDYF